MLVKRVGKRVPQGGPAIAAAVPARCRRSAAPGVQNVLWLQWRAPLTPRD